MILYAGDGKGLFLYVYYHIASRCIGTVTFDLHEVSEAGYQMKQCDFEAVLGSHKAPSLSSIRDELERCGSINDAFSYICKKVSDWVPCITDEYSRLRYATFFLEQCGIRDAESQYFFDSNEISKSTVQEVQFDCITRRDGSADPLFRHAGSVPELASLLRSIVKTKTRVSPGLVLDKLGQSAYTDSLIRDVVRDHIRIWNREAFCALVLKKIEEWIDSAGVVLDMLAEHRLAILTGDKLGELLERWEHDQEVSGALLRYIGECDIKAAMPLLKRMLRTDSEPPLVMAFAVIDALSQIGDSGCLGVLEQFKEDISKITDHPEAPVLLEYAELACRAIRLREAMQKRPARDGAVLVQCAFYGDSAMPGHGEGGGIATLLTMLGDSMSGSGEWDRIYTLFLFPLLTDYWSRPLIEQSGDHDHYIVRAPVFFPGRDLSNRFMLHEYEIMRAVHRTLEHHCIDPDLFHIRYSDNASKALLILSERLKKKVVFTLTPDPHRNLSGNDGKMLRMPADEALFMLNKVYIADRLVEDADGIILIGHEKKNDQIIPYFPALWIMPELVEKPLAIVPEGICMKICPSSGESYDTLLEILTEHGGRYRLDAAYTGRPILLNVGRLNRVKGQHLLLDAWAESGLSEIYNLVIIGGNLDSPDSSERMILEQMAATMAEHTELEGRFCLLHALPNREIRLFERAVMEVIDANMPNVYVCSSIKEEFGISILEAMSAGFLAVAPRRGGVAGYIEDGKNGYLIETHNSSAIRVGIESVLLSKDISSDALRKIAAGGKEFVSRIFDIDRVTKAFSRFYREIIEPSL